MSGVLKASSILDGASAVTNLALDSSGNVTVGNNLTVSGTGNTSFGGNVGIGITPSAWSGNTALQMTGPSMWGTPGLGHWSVNTYYDGTNYKYITTNYATDYYQLDGTHVWRYAASGTAGTNVTSLTEAMRIDASGNVGIGTNSPASKLHVNTSASQTIVLSQCTAGYAAFQRAASTGSQVYDFYTINNTEVARLTGDPSFFSFSTGSSATERMRIDSSGNVLIGTASQLIGTTRLNINAPSGSVNAGIAYKTDTTASQSAVFFGNPNGTVGSIFTSGSSTGYNTSSDYRLKENVKPMTTGLATISALNPVTYHWKVDGSNGEGFIAHELQKIIPLAVSGEKDAVNKDGTINPQGVDYSKIVVHLVAALQEAVGKITALEDRITKLESVK